MKRKNTGKALENLIEKQAELYHSQGLLYLNKVDPPTRTINAKWGKITTLLPNPFPDFVGCLPNGQMVCIEAKSTHKQSLGIGAGGLRPKQIDDLYKWENAGAKVGIIWQNEKFFFWVTLEDVRKSIAMGRKSVPMSMPEKITEGGQAILNFIEYLN